MASRPPVLLTEASFYGTLAALRCLGRAGIEVTVADPNRQAPALWSRFTAHREHCPAEWEAEDFVGWLRDFGRRRPGHVLLATSDELAWLLSRYRDQLAPHFQLYQPTVDAVYALLNKRRLAGHAEAVGLSVAPTWFPETLPEVERLAREVPFPVLLKPVTQILSQQHVKGQRVTSPEALPSAWEAFRQHRYATALTQFDASVAWPMVQRYLAEGEHGIESLSGFIDETGERFVVRASKKVLQRPQRVGVGVCFEATPVDVELAEGLRRLARRVGYSGVFEAEFIRLDGSARLIDFNPRFFGQMGFDVARGVKLPLLAYAGALGDVALIDRTLAEAKAAGEALDWKYAHRLSVEGMLAVQRASGVMSAAEVEAWRSWMASAKGRTADPVLDPDDWRPAVFDVAQTVQNALRHPRAFVRSIVLNR
jgi:predicted ATP-grasp superfamily ATP-dependent carboligase